MLIERYQLEAAAAFALLVQASSHQNRKLREIAAEVVLCPSQDV
jgi:AmiR/NasT family two-component response regulator